MAVFFQKISNQHFNAEADFVVRESKGVNLLIAFFFVVFAVAGFSMSPYLSLFSLIPALVFLSKGTRNGVVIVINKKGFYYYGHLITRWDNFVKVEFLDEIRVPDGESSGVSDNFSLRIIYYKDGRAECFARKISLTNTQDKAEEEIIAAINFYYSHYKNS